MTEDLRQEMSALLPELIERKEFLFPENHRMTVNFKITDTKKNFHIASTPPVDTK